MCRILEVGLFLNRQQNQLAERSCASKCAFMLTQMIKHIFVDCKTVKPDVARKNQRAIDTYIRHPFKQFK